MPALNLESIQHAAALGISGDAAIERRIGPQQRHLIAPITSVLNRDGLIRDVSSLVPRDGPAEANWNLTPFGERVLEFLKGSAAD